MSVVVFLLLAGLLAAEEPKPPVPARPVDPKMEAGGWKSIHTVRVSIEVADAKKPDTFQPVSPTHQFRDGQKFRLRLTPETDLYIYVLVLNADKTQEVLEPDLGCEAQLLQAKQSHYVPRHLTFRFEPPAGKERLRLLVSPMRLPWVEAKQLFEIHNGDELKQQEQAALGQLKSIKPAEVPSKLTPAVGVKSLPSMDAALKSISKGDLPPGARCLIVEDTRHELVLSLTSSNPNDRAILVHELELLHQ